MKLVERHIIRKSSPMYGEIDRISFLSKNLYNRANYIVRQEFIGTSKEKDDGIRDTASWIRFGELRKILQYDLDYCSLPRKVSQQVLSGLDRDWKSFFIAIKDWRKNPDKYNGRPKLPGYKSKTKGRNQLVYTIQAISRPKLRKGIVQLSGTNISVHSKQQNIKEVRIIPRSQQYVIEVVYDREIIDLGLNPNKVAGIDLGVNNIASVTSNQNLRPLLINGRVLKSINQYYNKKQARLMSYIGNRGTSNRLVKLINKRNLKVQDYMHRVSRKVVNWCANNDIGTLVIGYNRDWKRGINLGKETNQKFVGIPFQKLIFMIQYKSQLIGLKVILTEESYTSQCSFIDFESLELHDKYAGKRQHRGLFISREGIKINADCNGSGNIIRKVIPNAFADGIQGVVVRPVRINPYEVDFGSKIS